MADDCVFLEDFRKAQAFGPEAVARGPRVTGVTGGVFSAFQGCTGVTPRDRVSYGGKIFIPAAQGTTGYGTVGVTWYSDTSCSTQISTSTTSAVSQTG